MKLLEAISRSEMRIRMNIILLGAAGFIGTNLTLALSKDTAHRITLVDRDLSYFQTIQGMSLPNVSIRVSDFSEQTDFDALLQGQDIVFHLCSTTIPSTSNQHIPQEFLANVSATMLLLEACVRCHVRRVVFLSSGGAVYGLESQYPISEDAVTLPITSYGLQKLTIEQSLYLYHYRYGLDYRIIRLANPYGPYQRPNGQLGVVTTFIHKALHQEEIVVYGDGSVVRDFLYIDDAIRAIITIAEGEAEHRLFNVGSGHGTSVQEVIDKIESTLELPLTIVRRESRKVDVPVNYLDISRYEKAYGSLNPISLEDGILKTAAFLRLESK